MALGEHDVHDEPSGMTISANARIISANARVISPVVMRFFVRRQDGGSHRSAAYCSAPTAIRPGSVARSAPRPRGHDFDEDRERRTGARRASISLVRNMPVASPNSFSTTEGML
jgi:hypothetical protein